MTLAYEPNPTAYERQQELRRRDYAITTRIHELIGLARAERERTGTPEPPEGYGWQNILPPDLRDEADALFAEQERLDEELKATRRTAQLEQTFMVGRQHPIVAAVEQLTAVYFPGSSPGSWLSGDQWRERGETIGENADLVLLIEDSPWSMILNGYSETDMAAEAYNDFFELARNRGYTAELLTVWAVGFYYTGERRSHRRKPKGRKSKRRRRR